MSINTKSERTRAHILDAAWDLISVNGADVSLSDIANAAGLTRQSLYLHFGTRGSLLMAMVRRTDERLAIREKFAQGMSLTDPAKRLSTVILTWLDFAEEIYPVARELIRLRDTDADAGAAWDDRMSELHDMFRHLTSRLEAENVLHVRWTADPAADYLWAMVGVQIWGLLTRDRHWPPEEARDILKDQAVFALLDPDKL